MPRISLYKPNYGVDYKYMDRTISESFTLGGTDMYYHKLLGTQNPTTASADQPTYSTQSPSNIQDLLLLENRDRVYDTSIYRLRGHYTVQSLDWNLSQFGLLLDSDQIAITVHINDIVAIIGRKPISGDVFELPHLRDDFALNNLMYGMPRYYVVTDVNNASEGYSVTWQPHLYRLKCKKMTDSQQFAQILNLPMTDANGDPVPGVTLRDVLSTQSADLTINNAVIAQAETDAAQSGYQTRQFYTLAVDPTTGKPVINTADTEELDTSIESVNLETNSDSGVPVRTGYTGYLVGDGYPANGYAFGFGIQFPEHPIKHDFFLRVDFAPNRLFQFNGTAWVVSEDAVRMNMTNNDSRQTQKTSFINNTDYIYNSSVLQTLVELTVDQHQINTLTPYEASYGSVPYVGLKLGTYQMNFATADYPGQYVITTYTYNGGSYLQINLPVVNGQQTLIPYNGQWTLGLYTNREAVRQSLSQALRPRADL